MANKKRLTEAPFVDNTEVDEPKHENDVEPVSLDLLSIEEAKKLPKEVLNYDDWWWLWSPSLDSRYAARVFRDGSVSIFGYSVDSDHVAVRPALTVSNLDSSTLQLYKEYPLFDTNWVYIGDDKFLYNGKLIQNRFDKESNKYETSEIKRFLNQWLEKLQSRDVNESLNKSNKLTLNEDLFEEPLKEARDFEWDDTLWAVVKDDGRFAGIPCITDTEARDLAYQHEGSHIYKMTLEDSLDESLNEDLFDEIDMSKLLDQGYRVDMSVYNDSPQEDALEGPQTEEEVGVSHLILDAISCVTEMISMYNDITANTNDAEIIEVINQIAEDNNKHMGMLQGILTNVSPNAEAIQDGVEEVAADEVVAVDPEFIPVEESLDEEVSDTTLIGKVVANDGKELQKVLAQCGYSNVKHEGHYVFSAIKDGKVVYIDTKPLDDKNESEKIEIKSISESLNESFWFGKYVDIDGKTHKVYFKFEGDFEEAEEEFNEIIPEPYTKAVLSGRADEPGLKRDGFTLINEHLNEDLHDKFKKDIKNAYKQWTAEVEKVEQQRKELKDKFQDVESEEKRKEYDELTDKLFPMPADFKFEFPKNIEKDDFPFYVTYYAEYPIYEPAEGGYYYAGKDAIWSEGVNSEEEAWDYVNDFINEQEDKAEWEKFSDGYLLRGQYIGEDQSIIIEPRDSYLSAVKGWEPYQ